MSDFIRDVYAEEIRIAGMKMKVVADSYLEAKLGDVIIPRPVSKKDDQCPYSNWGKDGSRVYTYKQALCDASMYKLEDEGQWKKP